MGPQKAKSSHRAHRTPSWMRRTRREPRQVVQSGSRCVGVCTAPGFADTPEAYLYRAPSRLAGRCQVRQVVMASTPPCRAGFRGHPAMEGPVVDSEDSRLLHSHESLRVARGGAVARGWRVGEGVPEWVTQWTTACLRSIPTRRCPRSVPRTDTHRRVRVRRLPTQRAPFELFHSVNNAPHYSEDLKPAPRLQRIPAFEEVGYESLAA